MPPSLNSRLPPARQSGTLQPELSKRRPNLWTNEKLRKALKREGGGGVGDWLVFFIRVSLQSSALIWLVTLLVIRLQTELDDTKSCYQLIKTMTKFGKEIRYRLYVFTKKQRQQQQFTRRNARHQRAHMIRSVHLRRHDVLTVPLTVLLQAWRVHCPISAQIGLVITNHIQEFYH